MWYMCIYTLIYMYMNRIYFLTWVSKARFSERKLCAKITLSCLSHSLWLPWKLKAQPTNVVKNPSIFHSQDFHPHLPEVIICTFSLFFYFIFFHHFFLNFSTDILVSYYYSSFLIQAILHVFFRTFAFVVLISTQQWQFGYKHWKDNQRKEKENCTSERRCYLHHLLWVSHFSCLSYGLHLLMPWSQWRELNPSLTEFRTLALEEPTSLFSVCTIPAELCYFTQTPTVRCIKQSLTFFSCLDDSNFHSELKILDWKQV